MNQIVCPTPPHGVVEGADEDAFSDSERPGPQNCPEHPGFRQDTQCASRGLPSLVDHRATPVSVLVGVHPRLPTEETAFNFQSHLGLVEACAFIHMRKKVSQLASETLGRIMPAL